MTEQTEQQDSGRDGKNERLTPLHGDLCYPYCGAAPVFPPWSQADSSPVAPHCIPPSSSTSGPSSSSGSSSTPQTSLSSDNNPKAMASNSLEKLSSLVHKVGKVSSVEEVRSKIGSQNCVNFHELWWRCMKKEENNELKRIHEAKQIFTCLQCHYSFQTMDQLVKHMESTLHYNNIPKYYR
ncbi:unnamed protein product [Soboliphyme baturini]|uniref:C2H2-type domain-containing protein n=1 Tax=Soboliphyme baturini TaxID=241478 RepID=A0A183IB40_9BILA|nr:unnamed protein product [Soboliphyme baturini]